MASAEFRGTRHSIPASVRFLHAVPILVAALAISQFAFAVIAWLHFNDRVPAYQLIDDPAPYVGVEWYTGLISYWGVLLWGSSAAICAFTWALLRHSYDASLQALSRFLLALAAANLWMTLDDLFMVHEQLARHLVDGYSRHAGEAFIFVIYAGLSALCLWIFRATIMQTEYLLLLAAIVSLGVSVAIDIGFQLEMDGNNVYREAVLSVSWGAPVNYIAEEILKINGAMLWFSYICGTAYAGARKAMAGASSGL